MSQLNLALSESFNAESANAVHDAPSELHSLVRPQFWTGALADPTLFRSSNWFAMRLPSYC